MTLITPQGFLFCLCLMPAEVSCTAIAMLLFKQL